MSCRFSSKIGQGFFKSFKSNVMSPLNWLMGFLELVFMVGFVTAPNLLVQVWSGILLSLGLVYICGVFLFFALRDPDRLQSEEFLMEKQTINALYESKGAKGESWITFNSKQHPKIEYQQSTGMNVEDNPSLKTGKGTE